MDERIKTLAYNLVHFSCKLEKGEKVWISCNGVHPLPLVKQIIKETYRVGAIPFVKMMTNSLERELLLGATEEQQKITSRKSQLPSCFSAASLNGAGKKVRSLTHHAITFSKFLLAERKQTCRRIEIIS